VRLTRFHLFLLGGLILAIVGPVAFTQGPGGFGGRGSFGGKKSGRMGFDPETIFKQYSGGKDVIVVSEVQVPERMSRFMSTEQLREGMNTFLQKKGITNGQMTFALYQEYSDQRRKEMMEKWAKGKMGGAAGTTPTTPGTPTPAASPAAQEAQAAEVFKRLDTNNDKSLSVDEIQGGRRIGMRSDEMLKFDLDKNNALDLKEFTAYYKDWVAKRAAASGQPGVDPNAPPPEEDKRPVVYRAGKLPKELTAAAPWFEQLDRDKDGQVGLYEWKADGRPIKEFLAMDLNGDGFVTAEEAMRVLKIVRKDDTTGKAGSTAPASTSGSGVTPFSPGRGGSGMPGMRGKGSRGKGGDRGDRSGGRGKGNRFRGGSWGGQGGGK